MVSRASLPPAQASTSACAVLAWISGVVPITCDSMGRPASLCSTFGRADFMRVPLPAAMMTIESDMGILLECGGWREVGAESASGFRQRHGHDATALRGLRKAVQRGFEDIRQHRFVDRADAVVGGLGFVQHAAIAAVADEQAHFDRV